MAIFPTSVLRFQNLTLKALISQKNHSLDDLKKPNFTIYEEKNRPEIQILFFYGQRRVFGLDYNLK